MEVLASILLSLAIVLSLVRLIRGPTLVSRVVAFDLMTTTAAALIAVYAIMTEQPVFLDVAVVLALVSFLGTIAFAYYLERTKR